MIAPPEDRLDNRPHNVSTHGSHQAERDKDTQRDFTEDAHVRLPVLPQQSRFAQPMRYARIAQWR
jgi:hypothetical protein